MIDELSEDEKEILRKYRQTGGGRTLEQLEQELQLPTARFEAALARLIRMKLIEVSKKTVEIITLKPSERGWQVAALTRRKRSRSTAASVLNKRHQSQEQHGR